MQKRKPKSLTKKNKKLFRKHPVFFIIILFLVLLPLLLALGVFAYRAVSDNQPPQAQSEQTNEEKVLFDFGHLEYFSPLGISPDKRWLPYRASDTNLKLINITTKEEKALELKDVKRWEAVQWSPNSKLIASAVRYDEEPSAPGGNYPLWILSLNGAQNPKLLYEKSSYAFKWSPDGSKIAVITDDDRALKIYDASSFELLQTIESGKVEDYPTGSKALSWSPNSNLIIFPKSLSGSDSNSWSTEIVLWNLTSNKYKVLLSKPNSYLLTTTAWSLNGSKIALLVKDLRNDPNWQLKIYDNSGDLLKIFEESYSSDDYWLHWLSETHIFCHTGLVDIRTEPQENWRWSGTLAPEKLRQLLYFSLEGKKIIYKTENNLIVEKDIKKDLRDISQNEEDTSFEDNCPLWDERVERRFDEENHCQKDSDCRIIILGVPFCYAIVNHSANEEELIQEAEQYSKKCGGSIVKCRPIKDAVCSSGKCIHIEDINWFEKMRRIF